jgi:hypothetical protein
MARRSSPVFPSRWVEILDNVHHALIQADAAAARSAETLDGALGVEPALDDANGEQPVAKLEEQLRKLADCAAQAAGTVTETEALLADSETALRQWLAQSAAIRGNLAKQAADSV